MSESVMLDKRARAWIQRWRGEARRGREGSLLGRVVEAEGRLAEALCRGEEEGMSMSRSLSAVESKLSAIMVSTADQTYQEVTILEESLAEEKRRVVSLEGKATVLEESLAEEMKKVASLTTELAGALSRGDADAESLVQATDRVSSLTRRVELMEGERDSALASLSMERDAHDMQESASLARTRNDLVGAARDLRARVGGLERALEGAQADLSRLNESIADESAENRAESERALVAEKERDALRRTLGEAQSLNNALRAEGDALRRAFGEVRGRVAELECELELAGAREASTVDLVSREAVVAVDQLKKEAEEERSRADALYAALQSFRSELAATARSVQEEESERIGKLLESFTKQVEEPLISATAAVTTGTPPTSASAAVTSGTPLHAPRDARADSRGVSPGGVVDARSARWHIITVAFGEMDANNGLLTLGKQCAWEARTRLRITTAHAVSVHAAGGRREVCVELKVQGADEAQNLVKGLKRLVGRGLDGGGVLGGCLWVLERGDTSEGVCELLEAVGEGREGWGWGGGLR